MSESRKNHLNIDGGQIKEDEREHIASYKAIPESDAEFRTSKASLGKSKEKVSSDGAEEKLLQKEDEAKITTRVDMTDAKYIVGDHRNGDAKIELDANKRQFTGLTKEELLKYAEDPFWVRLRWFMFLLFWAMWLCMLAGAIIIIARAPKCPTPAPKHWFNHGPIIDMSGHPYNEVRDQLPVLAHKKVEAAVVTASSTYDDVHNPATYEIVKNLFKKAQELGVKIIMDLTPNYVTTSHTWFKLSENRTPEYEDFFVWANGKGFDESGNRKPPNNWVSKVNTPAWGWSDQREQFYLQQYGPPLADLNFTNTAVVLEFVDVLKKWMYAGASGIRLQKVRQLIVNESLANELPATDASARSADHTQYAYWRHKHASDQPQLDSLLAHWAHVVDVASEDPSVFTLAEEEDRPELFLLERNASTLLSFRPGAAAPRTVTTNVAAEVAELNKRLGHWPSIQLVSPDDGELAPLAMLLPATPILTIDQLYTEDNETVASESFAHLVALRHDASIEQGQYSLSAVPAVNSTAELIACARWKTGHTGYVAVYNPEDGEEVANISKMPSIPDTVTVHHVSHAVRAYTNYTNNMVLKSNNVLVPPKSSLVLSYVPKTTAEQ